MFVFLLFFKCFDCSVVVFVLQLILITVIKEHTHYLNTHFQKLYFKNKRLTLTKTFTIETLNGEQLK